MHKRGQILVAIAEDELPLCQLLQKHLDCFQNIYVAAAVSSGKDLLRVLETYPIEAVFLDIMLPDTDGLSIAAVIKRLYPKILIVFVTGHTEYAAESYKLEAVDYVVKPVRLEDISRAVDKIQKYLTLQSANAKKPDKRLAIKNQHELHFVGLSEVVFAEKELRKTVLHTTSGKIYSSEPLYKLQEMLGPRFFHCHKSFIINIDKIKKISPIADRLYEVTFRNYAEKVTMRRQKYEELCSMIISGEEVAKIKKGETHAG